MGNIIKASDLTVAQIQDGIIIYDPDTKDYDNNVIKWLVIGKNQDGNNTITIQSLSVIGDGAFGGGTGNRRYDKDPYKTDLSAEIQTWLDTDCFARFSYNFKEKTIPVTKEIVPYGIGGDVSSKECKLFNLSVAEIGGGDEMYDPEPNSFTYHYFQNIDSSSANTKRVRTGNFNGYWHLRSPSKSEDPRGRNLHLKCVAADGSLGVNDPSYVAIGPAPACVLADEIWLEEDGEGDYLISYTEPKGSYQKLYAYHEKRDGQYELKSYWTSSQTVEFENGQMLEDYKTALSSDIDSKGDEIDYSLDDGEIYLYSNGRKIATEEMSIRVAPNIQLDDISNLSIRLYQGNVRFTWTDPSDVIFSELPLVEWDGTKVIRKVGSAPNSVNDGTLVLDSKVRDAYSSTPYYDNNLTSGNYYYYRFFPYDKEGNYYGRTCGEVYKPIVLIPTGIPYLTETYTYTGSNITPNFVNYDTNTMTRSGTVYAKNAGTYTTTFTLKEGYKWSDDTTQPKEVTWSIGKAEGFITLDETNVEIFEGTTYVNILSKSNTIEISVAPNSQIATSLINGDIVNITYVGIGNTSMTLHSLENNNYYESYAIITISCVKQVKNLIYILGGADAQKNMYMFNNSDWMKCSDIPYNYYRSPYVVNNDKIYVLGSYSNSDKEKVAEYNHGTWTLIGNYITPYYLYGGCAVSYNNEIHVLGGDESHSRKICHYKSDPRGLNYSWINVSTLPYEFCNGSALIYDGEIHILGGTGNGLGHYRYHNSEWESVSELPYNFQMGAVIEYNNEIHILGSGITMGGQRIYGREHYKFNGNEWISVSTLPYVFWHGCVVVVNNELHILGGQEDSTTYKKHYKFNNGNWEFVSELPYNFYMGAAVVYNTEL